MKSGISSFIFALSLLTPPVVTQAQGADQDHTKHHPPSSSAKAPGPLDSLQKALDKNTPGTPKKPSKKKNPAPPSAKPAMNMGGQNSSMQGSGGMMGMMDQMMGQMGSSSQMKAQPSSELPGFPGASHIYHIGATGFFVDHAELAGLSMEQLKRLNQIKEKSMLSQSSFDRKIKDAEESLWTLTASDRPEIKSIEAKVREIESLKSERRISFIRDVGEAAGILTSEQRSILLGDSAPNTKSQAKDPMNMPSQPVPSGNNKPDGMNSMGDM
ncbi:MAG: hypothetical protein AB7G93_04750 [Bdellovibrionales bacterium]